MDRDTRNAIERTTQRARKLLEEDFAAQLEGDFDVHKDGEVAAKAGKHLSARQAFSRERIVAAIEHKRAAGMGPAEAARDYLRDAAFTTLNRFVALKMLEARDLVQECISKGEQSAGYREFCGMAPGLPLLPDSAGYRLYIESLFDELSTEVKVLFDRRDPSSVLWPRRATFEQLLEILNATELARVWGEDETIGWVYQFFNGQDERRKMREESQAPRNSRELAVRNQFFTPRYVVRFLTDNTLGRIWYEMRGTKTVLAEKCEYLVRKPGDEFVPRAKKDPRDLRVLDPACGSGHFLLYAFDLLLTIYEEAYADPECPKSEATGRKLAEDYPSLDALRKAVPGLVLVHNLHGVDIDPRCVQIAQLALWMRAQRTYRDSGIGRAERAQIRRSNIVVAEPLVADDQIAKEFVAKLGDVELGRVFTGLVEALNLAGDLGLLLRVEKLVKANRKQGELFAPSESRIRDTLNRFAREETGASNTRWRLFASDAEHGLGLLNTVETTFDVVLMNPPFGLPTERSLEIVRESYPDTWVDIYASFLRRAHELCVNGRIGAITSRSFISSKKLTSLRVNTIVPCLDTLLDLGKGVMDAANVEAAALVLSSPTSRAQDVVFINVRQELDKEAAVRRCLGGGLAAFKSVPRIRFSEMPQARLLYTMPDELAELMASAPRLEPKYATVRCGLTTFDDSRFVRLRWEVDPGKIGRGKKWELFEKGGEYANYYSDIHLVINRAAGGHELAAVNERVNGQTAQSRQASKYYYRPGCQYTDRSQRGFSARALPRGCVIAGNAPAIIPLAPALSCELLLGWVNSRPIRALIEVQAIDNKFYPGFVKQLPWPQPNRPGSISEIEADAGALLDVHRRYGLRDETDACFSGLGQTFVGEFDSVKQRLAAEYDHDWATVRRLQASITDAVETWYGVADSGQFCEDVLERDVLSEVTFHLFTDSEIRFRCVSFAVGCAFGRWQTVAARQETIQGPFEEPPTVAPIGLAPGRAAGILVDDEGHSDDLAARAQSESIRLGFLEGEERGGGREYLRRQFFGAHCDLYSKSRRKAPIYWQLATPSAGYSVWLYLHAFSNDTLFRVQNDYVAHKLVHEERRLESLIGELRDGANAAQRKQLAAQDALVEELRAFLDEVKRVAPLWKPNLDDGVIVNFALLWRLVPQNKAWQKELKSIWDALCEGKYDWAHLAMHLWPERVVPKCAKDRSLAIAHGLEDVFWVEGTDGKWAARETPTRAIDELVRERTSPAVKSALKSLLEAPVATGKSAGRKGGGRRKVAAAAEGGDV